MAQKDPTHLYAVYYESDANPQDAFKKLDSHALSDGLQLVRSDLTQSKLYHLIKRRAKPETLFVGRLDGDPKFKGMAEGALKWVRSGG